MFILCPRCELNYIQEDEEYCKICKAELGLIDPNEVFLPEDDEVSEGKLCPICRNNYIEGDEEMCQMCKREKEEKIAAEKAEEESINNWRDEEAIVDDDDDFNYDVDPNDFLGDEEEEEEEEEEDEDLE